MKRQLALDLMDTKGARQLLKDVIDRVDIIESGRYKVGFKKGNIDKGTPVRLGSVRFQFSKTLRRGEYSIRVGVSDAKGNRAVKRWSFKVE